ncbi:MAG: hypothetical protein WB441_02375 [Nocardioidaceae bacterium]
MSLLHSGPAPSGARASASTLIVTNVALGLTAGVLMADGNLVLGPALAVVALACAFVTARIVVGWLDRTAVTGWERLRQEIERARRHNSSLVVARLPITATPEASASSLVRRATASLRGVDHAWVEGRSLYVMLAGADRQSAQHGVRRVVSVADGLLSGTPMLAALPGDVLTMGALLDQLHPTDRSQSALGRVPQQAVPRLESVRVDAEGQATA